MSYTVKIIKAPVLQIRVRGEVLGQQDTKLREAFATALTLTLDYAVIDLSGVHFIDSSGLGLLMHTWKCWHDRQRRLIFLVSEGSFLRSMFEETNLTRQFHCISSLKEL